MPGLSLRRHRVLIALLIGGLVVAVSHAAPIESDTPIGGITFDPPRPASMRHKGGQNFRCELIAISEELVHFRLPNGRQFKFPLHEIRTIVTTDREFRFNSAHDLYRELVERAESLAGVTIGNVATANADGTARQMPRPPAPTLAVMLDSPEKYRSLNTPAPQPAVSGTVPAQAVAAVPGIPPPTQTAAVGAASDPFYETDGFKIGFLIACFGVIVFWWRNRVG
jgi:hypothetical protein